MSWVAIEDAMHSAVVAASGLAASKVYWSYQDRSEDEGDFVVISFGGEIPVGQDWIHRTTNLLRPNGQEILEQVQGVREVPFQIECYTDAVLGENSARRRAELIRSSFRLSSVRGRMRKAKISPFDSEMVSYVPDILTVKFRGRATVTIRCYVPVIDVYDYVGYIARVRGVIYPSGLASPTGATAYLFDSILASGLSGYAGP